MVRQLKFTQPEPKTRRPLVRNDLCFMGHLDPRDCLQFDEHTCFNNEVDTLARDCDVSVAHRHGTFTFESHPSGVHLEAQRLLVDLFEEARSECAVYLDGCANDLARHELRRTGNWREPWCSFVLVLRDLRVLLCKSIYAAGCSETE
jgi:hypothetical protein